mmetsp:Transcript_6126/g.19629  ORF Transcript_6126/g.19629 Transcript_6126/m.19629 type:complete len:171 (-) Transcript_6126:35-547(-)
MTQRVECPADAHAAPDCFDSWSSWNGVNYVKYDYRNMLPTESVFVNASGSNDVSWRRNLYKLMSDEQKRRVKEAGAASRLVVKKAMGKGRYSFEKTSEGEESAMAALFDGKVLVVLYRDWIDGGGSLKYRKAATKRKNDAQVAAKADKGEIRNLRGISGRRVKGPDFYEP